MTPRSYGYKSGIELIATERRRQIDEEKFDWRHDEAHDAGELAIAAACYAVRKLPGLRVVNAQGEDAWPWPEADKRDTTARVHALVKAGALLAAEIDRLLDWPHLDPPRGW